MILGYGYETAVGITTMRICPPMFCIKLIFDISAPTKTQFEIYFDFMNLLIYFFLVSAPDQRESRPHLLLREIS